MTVAWMLYALAVSALVTVGALALAAVAHGAARSVRWPIAASLVAVVALTALAPARVPEVMVVNARIGVTSVNVAPAASRASLVSQLVALGDRGIGAMQGAIANVATHVPPSVQRAISLGWLATTLLALVVLLAIYARFAVVRQRWQPAHIDGTPVRLAPDVGPAVIGALRPEIVLPAWILDRDAAEQRLVVAHEREHLRARDPALLALGWLSVALVPWNPFAWYLLDRLRLAVELDCDARVLRGGGSARTYGTLLVDLAGHRAGFHAGVAALANSPSHLERRLVAMRPNLSRSSRLRALSLAALAGVALVAACEARMPTQAEVNNADARTATALAGGDSTTYYVNGKLFAKSAAMAIPSESIMTVNIEKHAPGGTSVVRIVTRGGGDTAHVKVESLTESFAGLIFIDGKRATPADMKALSPSRIISVNVLKGEAAARDYPNDPAAKNGVIRIVTHQ